MKLGIIGSGNMGKALASGIVRAGILEKKRIKVSDIDEEKLKSVRKALGIETFRDNGSLSKWADTMILAVKPGRLAGVLDEIRHYTGKSKLVISIAAGIKIKRIERKLRKVPVIRAMPNTPAIVNCGITAIAGGTFAGKKDLKKASLLFSSVGDCVIVSECLMDAITALSGSGPAYIFFLAELMENAGLEINLPKQLLGKLVRETIRGSSEMLSSLKESPSALRERVTSRGGTTEAAISFLERKGFRKNFIEAVKKAYKRSKELSAEKF